VSYESPTQGMGFEMFRLAQATFLLAALRAAVRFVTA
jgi:hypothetical protein